MFVMGKRASKEPAFRSIRSYMLANGGTIEELLTEYPSLERDDILTCIDCAASLAEEQVTPTEALASTA